jgi:hypothetical protein
VNEATNKVYVLRSGPTDEVTIVDGATENWYSIAIESYWPIAMALHVPANRLYVATYATGDVRSIDLTSSSDHPPTAPIKTWNKPWRSRLNPKHRTRLRAHRAARGADQHREPGRQQRERAAAGGNHGRMPRAVAVDVALDKVFAAFEKRDRGDERREQRAARGCPRAPASRSR